MAALVGIGGAMAIWVTAMLYMERRHAKRRMHTLEAVDTASNYDGTAVERVTEGAKGPDSKV